MLLSLTLSLSYCHAFPLSLTLSLFISCDLSFPLFLTLASSLFSLSLFPVEGEWKSSCGHRTTSRNTDKKDCSYFSPWKEKLNDRLHFLQQRFCKFCKNVQNTFTSLIPVCPQVVYFTMCLFQLVSLVFTEPKGELFRLNQYCTAIYIQLTVLDVELCICTAKEM